MRFVCMFPQMMNVHLAKDVGMIPYILYKHYNIDAVMASYNNDSYEYINKEIKGLKIDYIKKYFNWEIIDCVIYIIKNRNNIDVLQLYHPSIKSFLYSLIFKFLNRDGKVYLKLDCTMDMINNPRSFLRKDIKSRIKYYILKNKIDLITGETKNVCEYLNEKYKLNIKYIPNGYYDFKEVNKVDFKEKDNIILTCGRIGSTQKNNYILVEAFNNIKDRLPNWKLRLVGSVEEEFKGKIKNILDSDTENRIEMVGAINDRELLNNEYRKSKVFCLTSIFEGFPLVLPEAMKNGNLIVSSDIDCCEDLKKLSFSCYIYYKQDIKQLENVLIDICTKSDNELKKYSEEMIKKASEKLYWPNICKDILQLLKNND